MFAKPPASSTPTSVEAPSELLVTVYSDPLYVAYSALTAECAATHGLPALPVMSQGPSEKDSETRAQSSHNIIKNFDGELTGTARSNKKN